MMQKLPFVGNDIYDLSHHIVEGTYPPLQGNYSPKLIDDVKRMLIIDVDFQIVIENICSLSFITKFFLPKISEKILSSEELNSLRLKYENGDAIEKNLIEAMKYYKMTTDLGNALGMVKYGFALVNGWSSTKDLK
jgi:hypothetical protein